MPPSTLTVLLAAPLLLLASTASSQWPGLNGRDQNPLLQGRYLPQNTALAANQWSLDLALINTENPFDNGQESLQVDAELKRLEFRRHFTRWGRDWWVQIPLLHSGSGWMDQPVYEWHDFWGMPQGSRSPAHYDQYRLTVKRDQQTLIDIQQPELAFADISILTALDAQQRWWGGVELPSGSAWSDLQGGKLAETALWYRQQNTLSWGQSYASGGLSLLLGQSSLPLEPVIAFAQAGVRRACVFNGECLFQLDAHSASWKNSDARLLGPSLQLSVAWAYQTEASSTLQLYLHEDILVGSTADFTLGLNWQQGW